jgi:hypothetical protein
VEIVTIDPDGSVTVRLTAAEAKEVRDDAASRKPWGASYTLSRHIAMIHGEPEVTS